MTSAQQNFNKNNDFTTHSLNVVFWNRDGMKSQRMSTWMQSSIDTKTKWKMMKRKKNKNNNEMDYMRLSHDKYVFIMLRNFFSFLFSFFFFFILLSIECSFRDNSIWQVDFLICSKIKWLHSCDARQKERKEDFRLIVSPFTWYSSNGYTVQKEKIILKRI